MGAERKTSTHAEVGQYHNTSSTAKCHLSGKVTVCEIAKNPLEKLTVHVTGFGHVKSTAHINRLHLQTGFSCP